MKRFLALIALCLCLAPVSVPASEGKAAPQVMFISPANPDESPFWGDYTDFMKTAAHSLGIDLTVIASTNRYAVVENARLVIARQKQPEYMVFIYQAKNSLDMLSMLEAAGIKSVISITDVIEADRMDAGRPRGKFKNWIGHVFPDDTRASRMLTERLIKKGVEFGLTDNDGILHLAGIGGSRDVSSGLYRKDGLEQAVAHNPRVVLDRYVWAHWKRDKARTKTRCLLNMYPDARVFWAVHDMTALGILDTAKDQGIAIGSSFLTGCFDWSPEAIREMKAGRLEASVGGQFMEGAWALVMILDYHNGHDFAAPDPTLRSETRLLDMDNLDTYLPLLDRANWKKVDFRRFTKTCNPRLRQYDFSPEAVLRQLNGK